MGRQTPIADDLKKKGIEWWRGWKSVWKKEKCKPKVQRRKGGFGEKTPFRGRVVAGFGKEL